MGGWRGEYTDWEWLQMAACLVGTPLTAMLGAWQASALRPKRTFVQSVLSGLTASAIAALACFAPFAAWVLMFRGAGSNQYIELFDSHLGLVLVGVAVAAAAGGAAYVRQVRLVDEKQGELHGAFNLRQLFLLQLLPFIVLGSWLGMRTISLNSVTEVERATRKWTQRGWEIQTDDNEQLAGLSCFKDYYGMNLNDENAYLREAATQPWLKELRFGVAKNPSECDFACFAKHPRLRGLHVTYSYDSLVSTKHLQELANISSLTLLRLKSAGSHCNSLAPLASAEKLERLTIETLTIDPVDLSGLKDSKSLKFLSLLDITPTSLAPIEFPESVEELTLETRFLWTLSGENFRNLKSLRELSLHLNGITKEEIAAISAAPNLESLNVGKVANPAELQALLQSPKLQSLKLRYEADTPKQEEALLAALEKIAEHPSLIQLHCESNAFALKPSKPDASDPDSADSSWDSSAPGTMLGMIGGMPTQLFEQKALEVQSRIAAIRRERGLPPLVVELGPGGVIANAVPRRAYAPLKAPGGKP